MSALFARYRAGNGRTKGLILALAVEALLVLVVLTLGTSITQEDKKPDALTSISFAPSPERQESPEKQESRAPVVRPAERPAAKSAPAQQDTPAVSQPVAAPPPAIIPIPLNKTPSADISNLPRQPGPPAPPKRGPMGPVDSGGAAAYADTARVGTAPNGQPLYAAAWYREPYDDELAGYLSTADGPGWGLIACRTAPDYRVENCVALDESPSGSRIARAVVAAAWQFKVRPPRVGGVSKVGEWVRIRIDYGTRRRSGP